MVLVPTLIVACITGPNLKREHKVQATSMGHKGQERERRKES